MGSCSSGGPNKFTGMCIVKGGDAAKEDDYSKVTEHQAYMLPNSNNRNRPGQVYEEGHLNPSSTSTTTSIRKREGTINSLMDDDYEIGGDFLTSSARGESTVIKNRNRGGGDSLNETTARRPNFISSSEYRMGIGEEHSTALDHSRNLVNTTIPTIGERYSSMANSKQPLDFHDYFGTARASTTTSNAIEATSLPSTYSSNNNNNNNNTAISANEIDFRRRAFQARKASAPIQPYRFCSNEYGNCIRPPPNKTADDARKTPRGLIDYPLDSTWTIEYDQKKLDRDQQQQQQQHRHYYPAAISATAISGYCEKAVNSAAGLLLPKVNLSPSASISSSYCHGSTVSSSSADSTSSNVCRRRDSGGNGGGTKRSSSVSGCLIASPTKELLPVTTTKSDGHYHHQEDVNDLKTKTDLSSHDRRHVSISENRPLTSAQRGLLNLLQLPMKPCNRADFINSSTSSTTTKYLPLNSEVSDGSTVAEDFTRTTSSSSTTATNNTVSNKNSKLERQT